jgi:hypothetical protein
MLLLFWTWWKIYTFVDLLSSPFGSLRFFQFLVHIIIVETEHRNSTSWWHSSILGVLWLLVSFRWDLFSFLCFTQVFTTINVVKPILNCYRSFIVKFGIICIMEAYACFIVLKNTLVALFLSGNFSWGRFHTPKLHIDLEYGWYIFTLFFASKGV